MNKDTQNQLLYRLLRDGGSITNLDAITKHGIGRLASRICDLTSLYNVPVKRDWEPNSDGEGRHVRYSMPEEARKRLAGIPLRSVYEIYR